MKTKGPKENFRVEVYPRPMTDLGWLSASRSFFYGSSKEEQDRWERDMQRRCEDIVADIKRHADHIGSVNIEFDQDDVCSHCGSAWTETSDTYNGGCCEQDEA